MKSSHLGILAFTAALAFSAYCSEGVDDVIKLQRSGVENEVIQAFVQDSTIAYELSVDDIQRLEDANVSATVIVAMIDHGKTLRNERPAAVAVSDSQPEIQTVAVAPADGQANISTFYESLAPYGTWSQDENASWVWEPTDSVRDPNWRPYATNGHWTWTDHGWYFESASPYGWATFHYGRWGYNREHRWSWAPDNVWGPAWVDWRQSDDHIGWAPLPFGSHFEADLGFSFRGKNVGFDFHADLNERDYCFVDSNRFLDVNIGIVLIPETRRHDVYSRTKIINNTYVYNDNRIINKGVSTTIVERATKRKIEEVKIEDARIAAGQPIRGEHRNANTIVAYRPKVANVSPVLPPAVVQRQKEKGADHKAVNTSVGRKPANEEDARTRLATEKAERKNAASAVKNEAAVNAEERQKARSEVNAERKANTEAEKESKAKLNEARNEAKTRENSAAVEQRKEKTEAATEKRATAAEENAAQREVRKEAAQEKVRENSAATEQRKEAAQEKNREARDAQSAKTEERKAANKEAVSEKKAAAEANREERSESKAEKAKEAKEAKDAKDSKDK